MGRLGTGAVAALVAGSLMTSAAFGAASKASPWQVVAGTFKSDSAAQKEVTKLTKKGFSGYKIETDKTKKYEVEKGFASQKAAKAAAKKLRDAGFKTASVENEKSEKTAG
jgi:hypothetical protein